MTDPGPLTEDELDAMARRAAAASPGPWLSCIESRDHHAGDDFIQITPDDDAQPDMYVSYAYPTSGGRLVSASPEDLDFIAHARQDVPRLVAEVRRLRGLSSA